MQTHQQDRGPHRPAPRPRRSRRVRLRRTVVAVTVLALAGAVAAGAAVGRFRGNLTTVELDTGSGEAAAVDPYDGGFDVLLVGSDQREGQGEQFGEAEYGTGALNDVTMLLHVSADHQNATVVSFPRDLLMDMPDCTDRESGSTTSGGPGVQLNTALGRGGLPCVAAAVTSLTGLQVGFAGEITFLGVAAMATELGGVPVCFSGPVHDRNTGLDIPEAGTYTLSGDQALALLRTRHGVGDGSDLGRISAQQVYLSSLVRTLQEAGTLTDVPRLLSLADAASRHMTLSTELADPRTMVALARVLADVPQDAVQMVMYPVEPAGNRVVPDADRASQLMQRLQSDQPLRLEDDAVGRASTVLDATPDQGAGAQDAGAGTETPSTAADDVLPGVVGQAAAQQTCVVPF